MNSLLIEAIRTRESALIPDRTSWRRSARAGGPLVDAGLLLGCLALTALAAKTPWSPAPWPVIAAAGTVASVVLPLRRRYPLLVAVTGSAAYACSGNPGPLLVGLYSAAERLPRRLLPLLVAVGVAGLVGADLLDEGALDAGSALATAALTAVVVAVGAYTATRRQLVASLRAQADRAETERWMREQQARADERTRIAREMHDVLAHKVALISLHAGALEVNASSGPGRVEQGAALIRTTAQEALEELRTVLGVLRADGRDADAQQGQDLAALVDSWRRAGVQVELHEQVGQVSGSTARAVFRLVQEGLTNAHKHAPGSAVTVSVTGGDADPVTALVANGPAGQPPQAIPGAGAGLVGLTERLRLVGGTLSSAPDGAGGWRLEGRLPADPSTRRPA